MKEIYRGYDIKQRKVDGKWNVSINGNVLSFGHNNYDAACEWVDKHKREEALRKAQSVPTPVATVDLVRRAAFMAIDHVGHANYEHRIRNAKTAVNRTAQSGVLVTADQVEAELREQDKKANPQDYVKP